MNAKKIMGAVLVALLAAALFVGAGAAAELSANGKTVFVYEEVGSEFAGTWANGANTITFEKLANGKYVLKGTDIVEGTYTYGDWSIIVKYPTAVISGIAGTGAKYDFIGGNLYKDDVASAVLTNATGNDVPVAGYILIQPNGLEQKITKLPTTLSVGTYKIQVYFAPGSLTPGTPDNYLYGKIYTFNVVNADDAEVTASADTILPAGYVKLTIVAKPGAAFSLNADTLKSFEIVANQANVDDATGYITVPNTGKVTFAIKANAGVNGEKTITVVNNADPTKTYDVDVTVQKGTISAETDAASYFVGDKITITGTSTAGAMTEFTLKGTNFDAEFFNAGNTAIINWEEGAYDSEEFEFTIATSQIFDKSKKLDVGTYTLTINTTSGAKATVPVVLKQPFISIVEAPEVIIQGDDAEFIVNAEATSVGIRYYIFGTNFFNASETAVTTKVKDTTNQFKFTLGEDFTKTMDAGQYFMVIQHPMYDQKFNILAFGEKFFMNTQGEAVNGQGFLFNVDIRQTANAAQALCDNLESQTIDDMYVKYSFFVVGEDESFTISDIPATIAQGETLTISGTSTANAEEYVTVEMISTAFAAVPKETVGSAAFIAVTTQIAEDGTWEVTFDTSDLNVDEYSLKIACGDATWKNVNINVVEAADEPVTPPTDKPDEPVTPPQDDAPETPGFGALAALAGLGAVAVLLLRRE